MLKLSPAYQQALVVPGSYNQQLLTTLYQQLRSQSSQYQQLHILAIFFSCLFECAKLTSSLSVMRQRCGRHKLCLPHLQLHIARISRIQYGRGAGTICASAGATNDRYWSYCRSNSLLDTTSTRPYQLHILAIFFSCLFQCAKLTSSLLLCNEVEVQLVTYYFTTYLGRNNSLLVLASQYYQQLHNLAIFFSCLFECAKLTTSQQFTTL